MAGSAALPRSGSRPPFGRSIRELLWRSVSFRSHDALWKWLASTAQIQIGAIAPSFPGTKSVLYAHGVCIVAASSR
jgi:hypothetical protein